MSARILSAILVCAGLSACSDHVNPTLERRDTILFGAGDSMRANAAIHVIDPWPAASRDTALTYDGHRAARAVERYRTRPLGGESEDKGPSVVQIPVLR